MRATRLFSTQLLQKTLGGVLGVSQAIGAIVCLTAWMVLTAAAPALAKDLPRLSHRDHLFDLAVSGRTVLAVGYPGVILRSTDGGKTFAELDLPTREAIFSVDLNQAGLAVAVGRHGLVAVSTDAGLSWTFRDGIGAAPKEPNVDSADPEWNEPPSGDVYDRTPSLFAVDVLPNGHVVAAGEYGTILLSDDAGNSWQRRSYSREIYTPITDQPPAGRRGRHGRTSRNSEDSSDQDSPPMWADDRDRSLEELNPDAADEARFTDLVFADPLHGWLVGEFGMVLRTHDGGVTWQRIATGTEAVLYAVAASSPNHVMVAGSGGLLLESHDAGTHWKTLATPSRENLFGLSLTSSRATVVGARGVVLTRKGRGSFEQAEPPVYAPLTAVREQRGARHISGARGHLLRLTDDGKFHLISGE